jgi:hypothetical protein
MEIRFERFSVLLGSLGYGALEVVDHALGSVELGGDRHPVVKHDGGSFEDDLGDHLRIKGLLIVVNQHYAVGCFG